jgi:tetratricopeptide (TPR) repeat protein
MAPLDRAKLLPAQLDVALVLGDLATARSAASELDGIAINHSSPALRAMADAGLAAVGLADGALDEAERAAGNARRLFEEIDLMYEGARVSLLLGRIHQASGDGEQARDEFAAALSLFERIGALPDANSARVLLAGTAA